ncbi:MAG: 3-methyl-2-oxobutanoate hydroxymethyltransferase, partial [Caldithrix sp.]|nr:3-methyl-2-oxobutanoate hydroxymethyltransferase [Caldithrix sp.]
IILVGDSGGMVMGGHENTLSVTMDEMLLYTKSVRRTTRRALLVVDMPFLSYQSDTMTAIRNAGRFLQEGGAEAVKMEGGQTIADTVHKLVQLGIPVMGHLGLTPQSIHKFGGYRLQGNEAETEKKLKNDAIALQEAGVFSIVLEKIPARLAREITETLKIPTIGIGAGVHCDGQVLVSHDMLGLYEKFNPKFVRRYAEMGRLMKEAFEAYIGDVKHGQFPGDDESF